ncbi:MAG TPA: CGNR zinc finger domain-containing protein [Gaiellales bacterium]|nr:CGNR zinc finger domain-containing protein [Gaiellales bacterium]
MASRPPLTGVELALGLVNTVDQLDTPPDFLVDHSRLQRFFVWAGYSEAADRCRPDDLPWVVALRDRLAAAIDADEDRAAEILNQVLDASPAAPALEHGADGWALRYGPPRDEGAAFLTAAAAVPLMELLAAGEWGRLGRCAASPCCCAYIDRSRNRSRRYCCQLCANRVTQAAARRRRRGGDRPAARPPDG